jgi:15-cis-phytoene synthase
MLPLSPERTKASPADLATCRQLIRDGSKSFFTASLLLPQRVRDPARSLYAFCRVADDAVDRSDDSAAAVKALLARLDGIYRGNPADEAADRAFADVVAQFAMPRALPEALIEGFAWDAEGRRYETIADVIDYGVRVAGTVGAMMSVIMGVRDPTAIARACDLGIAMQLTNIARDVGEDARNGRIYLPLAWMRQRGLDPEAFLKDPKFSPALASVIVDLLREADRLYARAVSGIDLLPASCRPSIHAARLLYSGIGREVERNGANSVDRRAVVPKKRKIRMLASALAASRGRRAINRSAPVDQARFLVEAVAAAPSPGPAVQSFSEQAAWVVDLFIRIEGQRS